MYIYIYIHIYICIDDSLPYNRAISFGKWPLWRTMAKFALQLNFEKPRIKPSHLPL